MAPVSGGLGLRDSAKLFLSSSRLRSKSIGVTPAPLIFLNIPRLTVDPDGDGVPVLGPGLGVALAGVGPRVLPGHRGEDELLAPDPGLAIRQRPPRPHPGETRRRLPAALRNQVNVMTENIL